MKKVLLGLMLLMSVMGFSQVDVFKNGVFTTKLSTGSGAEVLIKFKVTPENIIAIKNHEAYKLWEKDTYTNPENKAYVQHWKTKTHFELFLMNEINYANELRKMDCKNIITYKPIPDGGNDVRVMGDEIVIAYMFSAENGYGNTLSDMAYTTINAKNGEIIVK